MCKPTIWLSPLNNCDICGAEFGEPTGNVMFDAALPTFRGMWANVCSGCFSAAGASLGLGKGQRYELRPYGENGAKAWLKTDG